MAHDFEDIFDVEDLDDDELRQLVHEILRDNRAIDPKQIAVHVRDQTVVLAGRVGTEEERRIAERVVADRIGLEHVQNQLIVDPNYRAESPEAADEQIVSDASREGLLLGDRANPEDDEARHLHPGDDDDGTVDLNESLEDGVPWYPPESPTPEGLGGTGPAHDANRDF